MTSNIINFVHKDSILSIEDCDPNETLLNYIRTKLKKTGTKEGCAEGGCGACTVVLGELINDEINYKSVNACITFLPTLQGKQLIIVEDLISKDGSLHPVQEAMVGCHGSQCGFCTPGIVMSLYDLWLKRSSLTDINMYLNVYDVIEEKIKGDKKIERDDDMKERWDDVFLIKNKVQLIKIENGGRLVNMVVEEKREESILIWPNKL